MVTQKVKKVKSKSSDFNKHKCVIQINLYYYYLIVINNIIKMILNRGTKYKLRRLNSIQIKNICIKNKLKYDKHNELISYNDEIFHHENECFVCLELELYTDNSKTIKLNKMEDYIKDCSCDGWQ